MNETSRKSVKTHRLFLALPLPAAVRENVAAAQSQLQEHDWPVKWVDPNLVHITLKFLGDVEATRVPDLRTVLQDLAARHEPVTMTTGELGAFPASFRPRVFWLGLDGDASPLVSLASDLDSALQPYGFAAEERPFQPHITIGRLRRQQVPPAAFEQVAAALDVPAVHVPFDRIQLVRSILGNSGPDYTVFAEWKLGSLHAYDNAESVEVVEHG